MKYIFLVTPALWPPVSSWFKITHLCTGDSSPIMLQLLYRMRYKKEYAYYQSYARTRVVLPGMGQTEKERGESHEWAAELVAVDNKQSIKYNKNVSQQIGLTWFYSYYCITFLYHSLHTKNTYQFKKILL